MFHSIAHFFFVALASVLCASQIAQAASIVVVHAIDGRDLGLASDLPVDVSVNGACVLRRLTFKRVGAMELGVGTYTVQVFVSSTAGCVGTAVIERAVTIDPANASSSFSLVAGLTSAGAPQLAVFQDTGGTSTTHGGVSIRHVAKAGGIHARIEFGRQPATGRGTRTVLGTLNNGEEAQYIAVGSHATVRGGGRRYRVVLHSGLASRVADRRPIAQVRGQFNSTRRIVYVAGSATTGFSVFTQFVAGSSPQADVTTPTPTSTPTSESIVESTPTATPTAMCTQQATSTPTATSSATPTPSPTQGCGVSNPSCATPTPVDTPIISVQNVYRCSKLGEGRRTNGEAMPGYRCIGKDPCTPCEVECGHPSSVIDERETGGTSIIQYNRARTYFPSRMPEWPGGGTNYKPAPGTLDKACNLAGFLEHVSSTSTAWSSPGDNFLIYWDGAQRRFVKARGNTQGGRWAGSIRCKGLLHPSCRGPANLRWVFD